MIGQRLSLREPLAEALDVVSRLTDVLSLKKPKDDSLDEFLKEELAKAQTICKSCKDFERDFPSFAFSIATGIGKTRLMGACIAYLYLKHHIRHFFILAPNLTLYEKLIRDFGDESYEKYVFKGIAEFVHNKPIVITGENYERSYKSGNLQDDGKLWQSDEVHINIFNISKFNSDSKESKRGTPRMRRLSEYIGQSYFDYLSSLDDLVILMDEAHRYHADASKKAINELHPILGLEMTATPTDERGKSFKNIVYEYNLAEALKDGKYVKHPTVAKRRNFQKGNLTERELDILKLEDAISVHEQAKVHLELYSKQNNLPLVKPFILVVCKNIQHATEIAAMLENDMFDGRYKGKVLQIDSSTKKDEEIDRLFVSLEKPDNKIEIVVHVNMLKEGWDVTNLYTIVPLRAADAPILVEQSIGRGLRLPYGGRRTGNPDVDKLTVIAHENFEAVIQKAKDPNSVLSRLTYVELDEKDLQAEPSRVVTATTVIDQQLFAVQEAVKDEVKKQEAKASPSAIRAVLRVLPQMPAKTTTVQSKEDLTKPENREAIKFFAEQEVIRTARLVNPMFAEEEAKSVLMEVDAAIDFILTDYVKNIIEIPRMTIMRDEVRAVFKDFDLNTELGFEFPELKDEIIRQSLVGNEVDIITAQSSGNYGIPVELIVSTLINKDDIDYDENAELLYKLAEQAVDAVKSHLRPEADYAKVVYQFKKAIAETIYSQMKMHFVLEQTGFKEVKVLPFTEIVDQHLTEVIGYGKCHYTTIFKDSQKSFIRKYIFDGFKKSYYLENKFDSGTELDFANVLEIDSKVKKWLRPAPTQFNIYWSNGAKKYEPDFIVETDDCIYMIETKMAKDATTEEVLSKKAAAELYCSQATKYTKEHGGKPWKYVLLTHDKVDRTASFDYLIAI